MLPAGGEFPPEIFHALLEERAPAFGLRLPSRAAERLSRYLALLDVWRRRTNLTGPMASPELVEHVLESALGADLLPPGAAVDVGSGSGLPGIPLAILRLDVRVTPVEPRRRRRDFLDLATRELALDNFAAAGSSVGGLPAGAFSAAMGRAVGRIADILGDADFLEPNGLFLAWTTDTEALARDLVPRFRRIEVREVPGTRRKEIASFRKS